MNSFDFEHLYTVQDYSTFSIKVQSNEFSGISNFCLSKENIKIAVKKLCEMYEKLNGVSEFNDSDSDDFIKFEMEKLGQLSISGQLGGSHNEQYLIFKMISDQTILTKIIKVLSEV